MHIYTLPHVKCETGLKSRLLLENGDAVEGCGFGAKGISVGEIVFSTSMTGYTEALTDPSYAGQILVWTHPMVGCYGVPTKAHNYCGVPLNYESDKIQVEGFVISELPPPNHYLSIYDLNTWLLKNGVPGMYKVDTRALVKKLRERGVMMSVLAVFPEDEEVSWDELEKKLRTATRYDLINFAHIVSPKNIVVHEPLTKPVATIAVLDCGLKYGILRWLLRYGFKVIRYPCWAKASELLDNSNGIVVSNGPGNPAVLVDQIRTVREIVESGKPVLGICLGLQLISLSLGAKIYKLRYGHRGPNKGVVDVLTGKSYITTQNHGYAVDHRSLVESDLILWFSNIDDKSVEGVIHKKLPVIATQFHPEGGPGPHDTTWVFEMFKKMVLNHGGS
ncbi:glutamine-hydrolyzing carbamoyl-phosphate synthase small subunit [Ignisphaera sp. 4213-co]|uniref:Carbamoyl phosphate synthase small chain n=1 Tax=Ignisphaera cupida TaxID=3050454 RepID=A0ABD4Z8D8_9CREN|nr:glutamine-hydrolyzing carbamoyl-phosphate synthase small subunit [Ignisphaera sp. 4213-co]MDK6029160.1 glutamine-hydrolyzing carbamoyl-phosphate synthase small subunit [Ignisphaera sp. 4213-co]